MKQQNSHWGDISLSSQGKKRCKDKQNQEWTTPPAAGTCENEELPECLSIFLDKRLQKQRVHWFEFQDVQS